MKIFVTGATGVIGTRVLPRLIEAGHEVSVVARTAEQGIALGRAGAIATHVDLFSPGSVGAAVANREGRKDIVSSLKLMDSAHPMSSLVARLQRYAWGQVRPGAIK